MNMNKKLIASLFASAALLSLSACQNQSSSSTASYIGIDAAKEAALAAAGISSDQVSFSSAGLDNKNGTFYYEINFSENGIEYEYDIDAITGVVIEEKKETESAAEAASQPETSQPSDAVSSQAQSSSSAITEEKARSIALSHAGLTEENVSFVKVKKDFDDGISVFEVEFYSSDGVEYQYDINADTGSIINYDQENKTSLSAGNSSSSSGTISEDQAKQSVLERIPGASAADIYLYLDSDDGRLEYEGQVIYDNTKYEFKVDAYSGSIIEWEAESIRR